MVGVAVSVHTPDDIATICCHAWFYRPSLATGIDGHVTGVNRSDRTVMGLVKQAPMRSRLSRR
jgi:hypothetical protein